jgi:signal transduction histidine kinase
LRTHPTALIRGQLCDNPFYEAPAVAVRPDDNTARVAWMMRQLRLSHRTRRHLDKLTESLAAETAQLASENQQRRLNEEALRKALEMRDRFLALLADELWVPMGPLLSQLQSLVRGDAYPHRMAESPAATTTTTLGAVAQQLTQLSKVVEEARDISRLTNRQASSKLEDFDLTDAIRQVTLRRREQLAEAGCSVSLRTAGRIQGRWDRPRVEQVASNLLVNAMTRGRGTAVDLELSCDDETAALAVRDRGAAIAAADQALLFDRLEGTLGGGRHSPARGLWVTREIVNALGGSIEVSNQPDGAVAFCVELPRSRSARRSAV